VVLAVAEVAAAAGIKIQANNLIKTRERTYDTV